MALKNGTNLTDAVAFDFAGETAKTLNISGVSIDGAWLKDPSGTGRFILVSGKQAKIEIGDIKIDNCTAEVQGFLELRKVDIQSLRISKWNISDSRV